jgi:hypothetical protein
MAQTPLLAPPCSQVACAVCCTDRCLCWLAAPWKAGFLLIMAPMGEVLLRAVKFELKKTSDQHLGTPLFQVYFHESTPWFTSKYFFWII